MTRSVENWLLSIAHELCRQRASIDAVDEAIEEPARASLWLSFSCPEAERALSLTLDDRLPPAERVLLRAHLRRCGACTGVARRHHAQRLGLRALADSAIPRSLGSFSPGKS